MKKYKCKICNKKHTVYYSTTGGMPLNVIKIRIDNELSRIEELYDFLHLIDKKDAIVKGNISIETCFTEYPMTHEAWIEIPIKDYISQVEKAEGKPNLELVGKLATELPFHQNCVGLEAKWVLERGSQLGEIKVLTDSELKEDQQKAITEERITKMMELMYHPELYKEKVKFEKTFEQRFKKIVKKAKAEFTGKSKLFVINISSLREVLFQLISSELSVESRSEIGIHLSNDEINENYKLVQKRMSSMCDKHLFNKFLLDGIDTYQKNYQFNDETLFADIKHIVDSVYEENIEELELEISEM